MRKGDVTLMQVDGSKVVHAIEDYDRDLGIPICHQSYSITKTWDSWNGKPEDVTCKRCLAAIERENGESQ